MGAKISPAGWLGLRLPPLSLLTMGIAKASVLPLPVLPRPSTSRPASVSGSVSTWIGKGAVMPSLVNSLTKALGTPSSAKDAVVVMMNAFQAMACVVDD